MSTMRSGSSSAVPEEHAAERLRGLRQSTVRREHRGLQESETRLSTCRPRLTRDREATLRLRLSSGSVALRLHPVGAGALGGRRARLGQGGAQMHPELGHTIPHPVAFVPGGEELSFDRVPRVASPRPRDARRLRARLRPHAISAGSGRRASSALFVRSFCSSTFSSSLALMCGRQQSFEVADLRVGLLDAVEGRTRATHRVLGLEGEGFELCLQLFDPGGEIRPSQARPSVARLRG